MTLATTEHRTGPADMLAQMGPNMYRRAYEQGMSLSAYVEREAPSGDYKDGLDTFGRMLKASNIRTQSLPEYGVWAETFAAFEKDDNTWNLVPEWVARKAREVQTGKSANTRSLYTSGDYAPGSLMNPYVDSAQALVQSITPAIPLSSVVSMTVGIPTNVYQHFYLTDVTSQERMVRVTEGAEIPRVKLAGGTRTINLYKYGRVIEITYEQLRRQQIDVVALHIAQMAAQTEADRVAAALTVIVSGDGNANTAATNYNLTTLDSAAVQPALTLKAWLAFKMLWQTPMALTTVLGQSGDVLKAMLLNVGSANVPLVNIAAQSGFGGFTPINAGLADNVALGWTSQATANYLVGFDRRFSLLRLTEIGADINEVVKWATRQTDGLVMTQSDGFAVMNPAANKTLRLDA